MFTAMRLTFSDKIRAFSEPKEKIIDFTLYAELSHTRGLRFLVESIVPSIKFFNIDVLSCSEHKGITALDLFKN